MSNNYYPELEPGALLPIELAFQSMLNDPLWLDRSSCPYDNETKSQLRELWAKFRARPEVPADVKEAISSGADQWTDVADELRNLFNELKTYSSPENMGLGMGDALDPKEKMTYFRTATSLLDKIVSLGERANNIKAVSEFQSSVLKCFDDILSPEQRSQVMEILGQ